MDVKEAVIERAFVGEDVMAFLGRMQRLRLLGVEAICEFNGVRFNNMDGQSVTVAYSKALEKFEQEKKSGHVERENERLKKRMEDLEAKIMGLSEEQIAYTLEDLVRIILEINALALEEEPAIDLIPTWCEKLSRVLSIAGFEPVAEEMRFQNAGVINMHQYAPPAPAGKETVELPFYSGCAIYVPKGLDLRDLEQLKTYTIGNIMAQLKTGKLDIANLELLERLSNKLQKQENTMGTM